MKKVVTIFSNYLQPVFVKLMLRNTSATFFIISLCERVFLWKKPRTRKENVFWDCFWDKPTTFITSSTRVMKMKFCDYWENFCSGELRVNRVSQFGRTEFSRMIGPKQSFSCSFRIIWKKIMESKTFCLGELFTLWWYKRKNEEVWRGKFCEPLGKRFTHNRSCKSKKKIQQ